MRGDPPMPSPATQAHSSLAATALEEDSKALYGVPGPGAYVAPSAFSQKLAYQDPGRQIYTCSPAWTLKGRIEETQQFRSPGPVYDASRGYRYLEQHGVLHKPESEGGTFGVGPREQPHRFYSAQHSQATLLCTASPGPATYKQREGRRVPHTLGDAPTWHFGVSLNSAWGAPAAASPGPVYKAETAIGRGTAPVFTRAPIYGFGRVPGRKRGLLQSRSEALKVLWSREQRKEEGHHAPGPGFYRAESAARALIKHAAAFSFSSADTGRKGVDKEATALSDIHLPSTFNSPCTRFGPARAHSVPPNSATRPSSPDFHTQLEQSAESQREECKPGPGQYDVLPHVTALSSHPRAPAPSFGSEQRQCNKRAASALLSDRELEQSVAGYPNPGAASFGQGKATSRYTFIPRTDSPGPIYDTSSALGNRKGSGPRFGDKAAPAAAAHTQTVPDFFTGAIGSLGLDSPGPNINIPQGKPSRLGPGTPWGKWKHGVKLPPRLPAAMCKETSTESKQASPGPCYNPAVSLVNSKHSNSGSFSFGFGGRTPMHTVKF
ncbi:hypothetical protein ABBQ38_007266 [Trebouxia sp. C0009 RCD-2024]